MQLSAPHAPHWSAAKTDQSQQWNRQIYSSYLARGDYSWRETGNNFAEGWDTSCFSWGFFIPEVPTAQHLGELNRPGLSSSSFLACSGEGYPIAYKSRFGFSWSEGVSVCITYGADYPECSLWVPGCVEGSLELITTYKRGDWYAVHFSQDGCLWGGATFFSGDINQWTADMTKMQGIDIGKKGRACQSR